MGSDRWNRKSALCAFLPLGILSFLALVLSAASVGLERMYIIYINDRYDDESYTYSYDSDYSTGPSSYPWTFSGLWFSIVTFLTFLIAFPLVLRKKANPIGVAFSCFLWALAWLGLFGYGCYAFSSYGDGYCVGYNGRYCRVVNMEFAFFIFTPLVCIACISVGAIAVRANTRKYSTTHEQNGTTAWPQQPQAYPQQQPPQYPQPQPAPGMMPMAQPAPMMSLAPTVTEYSRPTSQFPSGPNPAQPFYQNGQWYSYQPVPMPGGEKHVSMQPPGTPTLMTTKSPQPQAD